MKMQGWDDGLKFIIAAAVLLPMFGIVGLKCDRQDKAFRVKMAEMGQQQQTILGTSTLVWQAACPCSTGAK